MVMIPAYGDPTLNAMLNIVGNRPRDKRNYLGASLIGDLCWRKIFYKFNGYPEEKSEWANIANCAADSGYFAEDITAKRLREVPGVKLFTHDENGKQFGFSTFGGKFKGHVDGVIIGILQAPKANHIWEHKDKDHKKFSDFQLKKQQYGEKNTLKNWSEEYYGQAQINMHYFQYDRHYMTVSYAGARKYDSCRTEYNPEDAAMLVDKADKIIHADREPQRISDNPDFFKCRICEFRTGCHDGR